MANCWRRPTCGFLFGNFHMWLRLRDWVPIVIIVPCWLDSSPRRQWDVVFAYLRPTWNGWTHVFYAFIGKLGRCFVRTMLSDGRSHNYRFSRSNSENKQPFYFRAFELKLFCLLSCYCVSNSEFGNPISFWADSNSFSTLFNLEYLHSFSWHTRLKKRLRIWMLLWWIIKLNHYFC